MFCRRRGEGLVRMRNFFIGVLTSSVLSVLAPRQLIDCTSLSIKTQSVGATGIAEVWEAVVTGLAGVYYIGVRT